MSYTLKEIIEEAQNLVKSISTKKKKRERSYLDKRNYLISLLYFKFNLTESKIEEILNINRLTIHSAKWQAFQLINANDISFIANANEYIIKYPFDFPKKKLVKDEWILKNLGEDEALFELLKTELYERIEEYIPELKERYGMSDEELDVLIDGYLKGHFDLPPETPDWIRDIIENN